MQSSHRSDRRNGANRLSAHYPSSAQDPQMLAQMAAFAAHQQQEAAIQAQLHALNAKIIQAQTLAHANGWTVDEALIRVWGGLTEDEIKLLKLKALREEQARREHELRMMRGGAGGAGGAGLGDQLQQNAFEIERAQAQLRALQQQQQQQQQQQHGGAAASAHEQRLAAKQQIEANLRARSGRNMIKAVQQHQTRMPSPPSSEAGSIKSEAQHGGGGSSGFFDRRVGGPHSPPITTTASSPAVEDPWADQKPSLGALRRHVSRASESGSDVTGAAVSSSSRMNRPAALVVRQPIGPPAGADELGDRNFASRMRAVAAY